MCLAIPVRVVEVLPDQRAIIDLSGVRKEISVALLDSVAVGDYVILHVGYALGKLDPEEALQTLALFGELAAFEQNSQEALA
jgi:hydrogenase expression/formation protein HypC